MWVDYLGGGGGGEGGAKGMLAPSLKLLGRPWPPWHPLFLRLCLLHIRLQITAPFLKMQHPGHLIGLIQYFLLADYEHIYSW